MPRGHEEVERSVCVDGISFEALLDPTTTTDDDLEAFVQALKAQAHKDARVKRRSREKDVPDGPAD